MKDLSSFLLVVALWLAASVGLWWADRRGLARKRRRQREFVAQVWSKVRAAQEVFDTIRFEDNERAGALQTATEAAALVSGSEALPPAGAAVILRNQTTMLLRRIQEVGPYFDSVRALHPELKRVLEIENCSPLAEVLQIRRDLWAASEIVLIDDVTTLGDAFAEPSSYERFCEEARRLLFKGQAEAAGEDDLIDLRLSVARTDVEAFAAGVEEDILAAEERERFPTLAEIVSYPVAAARAVPGQWRTFRAYAAESIDHIRLAARNLRESRTVAEALSELRRARGEFPGLVNASMEKAAALARNGRESIVAHQHLLAKAYDLQAKYQEVLQRAPELTDRGRQFIARLELTKRSEQLRETSKGMLDDGRRLAVRGLAHLIAGLVALQERLAVRDNLPATMSARSPEILPPQKPAFTLSPRATSAPKPGRFVAETGKPQAARPIVASFETGAKPPPVRPEIIPARIETQPISEQPSAETLNRLNALFSRHPPAKPRQAAANAQSVAPSPLRASQENQPISPVRASDLSDPKPPAATQASGSVRRLWPALDKLRDAPVSPASQTTKDLREDRKAASGSPGAQNTPGSAAIASTPPLESVKATPPKDAKSFFGRKKGRDIEVIPPVKPVKSPIGGASSGQLARARDEGSIAEMLARLRLADAELLEAEAFGGPRPAPLRAPSLLSKLSTVGASQFDDGATVVMVQAPERTHKTSEPASAPVPVETVRADEKKSARFSMFRRK
ncbi:MAG: hypothetical protein SGJ17_06785 [Hyphomicrobiales bacterium]|nr:hypothetical protein [Hyphomicrobiales bacterium]